MCRDHGSLDDSHSPDKIYHLEPSTVALFVVSLLCVYLHPCISSFVCLPGSLYNMIRSPTGLLLQSAEPCMNNVDNVIECKGILSEVYAKANGSKKHTDPSAVSPD